MNLAKALGLFQVTHHFDAALDQHTVRMPLRQLNAYRYFNVHVSAREVALSSDLHLTILKLRHAYSIEKQAWDNFFNQFIGDQ